MQWNLRLVAASRGIWKASEMQQLLARHGLRISAGKMSGLWSGQPASLKLSDLDVLCRALSCGVEELLVRDDDDLPAEDGPASPASGAAQRPDPGLHCDPGPGATPVWVRNPGSHGGRVRAAPAPVLTPPSRAMRVTARSAQLWSGG